ncbi:MAG: peptidoglycan DD-metalloendopeptidase family protein [Candidatus Aminicenantes bacterium]|jgi:murein DD-endopeptidase MepM/ murein hydrolase activator NlpD
MKVKIKTHRKKTETRRIHLLLFTLFSFSLFLVLSFIPKKEIQSEVTRQAPPAKISNPSPPLEKNKKTIRWGMTLTDILAPYDFTPTEIFDLSQSVRPVYDLSKIKAGQEIRVCTTQQGEVVSLEYDIDEKDYLLIQIEEGIYTAEIKKIPYENRVSMIWGTIQDYLISAVNKEEEGVQLALDLVDLFAWDIDFYADLRKGDSFKILFEKKYLDGKFVGYGNILAAEFTNQDKTFQAFRYTYSDTKESDHYDLEGNSLRKTFMKSPIRYDRITSRFSYNRLHPIRKVYRPHYGVDYAARIGTPVQATADGTVIFAGRKGASGRMVGIRHQNRYETQYLHLRGFARGIKKGVKVREGQEIGYVGSSGESTGPHLDYRIKKDGKYINPLAFNPEPVSPLRAEFLEDFKKVAQNYLLLFDASLWVSSCFGDPLSL